ncbi:glycosyltransferase family 4 protein [Pseudoalteromonas sp. Cn5-37]|uniref:glycosyltransferase family 4 protein n=1 Tax=Pseudoalteromonas sp. Cn5-37 TaxID=2908886 RepID=UPI001F2E8AB2|nr:glycosyltransferase family 4 protein [Pseudoalteromonas sp. Cn5-37]MCF2918007.1 glycosyltransferase family 4 protein [Pseudoalteromonas sp. Cn5-37]
MITLKKHLLFVVNVDWFFISHRLPIAKKALEKGYKVTIACRFTEHKNELYAMGFSVVDIPFSRSGGGVNAELNTIKVIKRVIDDVEPSLIHAITIKPVLYTGLALKTVNKDIPFIAAISGLGYVFTANTLRAKVTKLIASVFYKIALSQKFKTVIFQNTSDEAILTRVAKLNSTDKTLIKGSGADLSVYRFEPENLAPPLKVAMACRLLKEKGVYQYIEAARLVKKTHFDVEFLLIGTPDLENPNSVMQTEIDSWVKEGVINYLGHRNDIPDVFSSSSIVCLPSFYGEGVPKVLIEAAACGRAIVTTDNPGCRDAIIEGETGLAVPVRDSEKLAEALICLIEDTKLRSNMGLKARKFAEQEFDVNSVVDKHLEIYDALLARNNQ